MKAFPLFAVCLLLIPLPALAGPNAGGTLLVHSTGLVYGGGNDTTNWCGASGSPASCGLANTEIDDSSNTPRVWKVFAAFDSVATPRLKALDFGINYDAWNSQSQEGSLVLLDYGPCIGDLGNGAMEYPGGGWPNPGTGTVLVFQNVQTTPLVEAYWFAGYAYYGAPSLFQLTPGKYGGVFADDSMPAVEDTIAAYGSLGFNEAGSLACPGQTGGGQQNGNQYTGGGQSMPGAGSRGVVKLVHQ